MADENDNMDEDKRRRDWDAARAAERAGAERRAQEDTARKAEAAKFQQEAAANRVNQGVGQAASNLASQQRTQDWTQGSSTAGGQRGLHNDGFMPPLSPQQESAAQRPENQNRAAHAKPAVKAPVFLVDIKEDPHVRGSLLVEATAPDGTIESATFSGPRASHRAMKYVEAIDGFEKRPPREYPKYVRRGGVEHILLDAEHEKTIGPPTDADKAADEAQKKAAAEVGDRHAAFGGIL